MPFNSYITTYIYSEVTCFAKNQPKPAQQMGNWAPWQPREGIFSRPSVHLLPFFLVATTLNAALLSSLALVAGPFLATSLHPPTPLPSAPVP